MNGETPVYEFITFNKSAVSLNQCGSATQSNKVVTGSSHDETRQATNSYPAQAATVRAQRRTIDSIFSCTTSIGERAEIDRPRWSAGARGHRPMNKPSSNTRPMTRLSPWCAPCVGSAPRVPTVEIAVGGDRGALPPAIPRGEIRVRKKPQAVQVGLEPCAGRRETNGQAHARKRSKYSSILRTDEKERLDGVEFTPSISVVVSRRRGQKERDDGRACPDDGTREAGVLLPREHLLQQDEHAAKHVSRDAAVGREMAGDRGSSGGGAPGVGEEQRSRSIIASHKSSLNLSRASPDLWCRAAESDCACAPLALDLKPPHACLSHACRSHADGRKLPENYGGWRVALGPPKPMGWPKSGALPPLTTATTSSTTALTVATAATKIKLPQESVHAGRETEASADRPQATLGIAGAQEMGGMQTETVAAEADEKGAGHEAVTQEGGREEGDESGDEGILDLLQLPSSSPFRDDGDLDAAAKDVGSNDWVSETRGLAEVALPCFEAADTSSPASAMWVGPPSLRLETIETCLSPALSVIDSSFGGWGRDDLGMWERTANFGEWWRVDADSDQVGVSGGEPVTSVLAGPKTKVPQSRLNDKKYNSLGLDMTKIGASKAEAASMQRTKDKEASSRTLQASSIDASACTLAPSFSPISRKTSMGTKQVCKGGHGGPRGRGQARIPWRKESASDGERVDGYVESTSSSSLGGIYIGPELCLARERRDKLLQRPFLKKNAMVEPERTSTVVTGTCHPGGERGMSALFRS